MSFDLVVTMRCTKARVLKFNSSNEGGARQDVLLHIVNAVMNEIHFFGVAKHPLTLVGTDGCYTKPLTLDYIVVSPGQTMDCLLHADQEPLNYYMVVLEYSTNYTPSLLPDLPYYDDSSAVLNYTHSIKSIISKSHLIQVPQKIDRRIVSTISINHLPPNGTRLAASMNNISFVAPKINILEAYYYYVSGVYGKHFPDSPPFVFNYTADSMSLDLFVTKRGTQARVLRFNSSIEVVFQGTNQVVGLNHPMHLHGYFFYVVGWGFGNINADKDPLNYNLVEPQKRNTIIVPRNGWTAVRFVVDNPGVWFLHCHFERHATLGIETVFIVKNGKGETESVRRPPPDMPPC